MGEAKSFYTFWVEYLHQHELLATRLWHFVGTSAALVSALLALITWHWIYLAIAFVVSYGCSWMGHFFCGKESSCQFSPPHLVTEGRPLAVPNDVDPRFDGEYQHL
jgi:hypothetical protein